MNEPEDELIEFPIDGVLDLHTFQPDEVKDLVPDYIQACLDKNIYHLRIIHGKGTGTLKAIVWSILEKHPAVAYFRHEDGAGGWGATAVELRH
jgi:DNA-nicking Smr family endonuclease